MVDESIPSVFTSKDRTRTVTAVRAGTLGGRSGSSLTTVELSSGRTDQPTMRSAPRTSDCRRHSAQTSLPGTRTGTVISTRSTAGSPKRVDDEASPKATRSSSACGTRSAALPTWSTTGGPKTSPPRCGSPRVSAGGGAEAAGLRSSAADPTVAASTAASPHSGQVDGPPVDSSTRAPGTGRSRRSAGGGPPAR